MSGVIFSGVLAGVFSPVPDCDCQSSALMRCSLTTLPASNLSPKT